MRLTAVLLILSLGAVGCASGGTDDDAGGPPPGTDAGPGDTDAGSGSADCTNGVMDGDETGTDCGGSCSPCQIGQGCNDGSDCMSGVCTGGTCAAPSCGDGVMNGQESDVDCGGNCDGCVGGQMCAMDSDCLSNSCMAGTCSMSHCDSGVLDGDETDVDCGGSMCPGCDTGEGCDSGSDCASMICTGGSCAAPACDDMIQNGDESDVDCGGSTCAGCSDGSACVVDGDCANTRCVMSVCVSCMDGVTNGDESDVDCGGTVCAGCADGSACNAGSDCVSGVCTGGTCTAPSCTDGVVNGGESGVDCGGTSMCPRCGTGAGCTMASDCDSGVCDTSAMTCAAPSCTDMVLNGGETDVDCGGSTSCPRCADGLMCTVAGDCVTGMCTMGRCGNNCGIAFLRINELHGGDGPGYDFIDIVNTGTCAVSLAGVEIATGHNCSSSPMVRYAFPAGSMLAAGAVARVRDTNSGLLPNQYYAGPICWDAGRTGWTVICNGACDLSACSNFIDYQEQNETTARATGAPACGVFTPAPFDVSSITSAFSTDAVHRVAFGGSGNAGVASDWAISPHTP